MYNDRNGQREIDRLRQLVEILEKRLRHLLSSDFINSFDNLDRNGNYIRDIHEADYIAKFPSPNKRYIEVEVLGACCRSCPEFNIVSSEVNVHDKYAVELYKCANINKCKRIQASIRRNTNERS